MVSDVELSNLIEDDEDGWVLTDLIQSNEERECLLVGDYRVVVREDYVALVRISRGRRLELRGSLRDVVAAYIALVDRPEEEAIAAYYASAQELYFSSYPDKRTTQGS